MLADKFKLFLLFSSVQESSYCKAIQGQARPGHSVPIIMNHESNAEMVKRRHCIKDIRYTVLCSTVLALTKIKGTNFGN